MGLNLGPVLWRLTTVKWRQFSQSNRHSTIGTRQTEYHEAILLSMNVHSHLTSLLPTMVTLHDTRFVECRWWNDGWTVKTVVTWQSSASMIPAPGVEVCIIFVLKTLIMWDSSKPSLYHVSTSRQTAPEHTSLLPTRHARALGIGHNWHQGPYHSPFPL